MIHVHVQRVAVVMDSGDLFVINVYYYPRYLYTLI
jgi:hypothetical protein